MEKNGNRDQVSDGMRLARRTAHFVRQSLQNRVFFCIRSIVRGSLSAPVLLAAMKRQRQEISEMDDLPHVLMSTVNKV